LYERRLKLLQQEEKTFLGSFCENKDKRTFENILFKKYKRQLSSVSQAVFYCG